MIAAPPPPRTRMTNAEYLSAPETNQRIELIDGEIIGDAPTINHQTILLRICIALVGLNLDGVVIPSPVDVVFGEGYIPQPDIVWVAPNSQCAVEPKRLYGAPDLIVEILSPSTEARDRGDKYALYEKHGVREYWLVNPDARFVEVYALKDGAFARAGIYAAGEQTEFSSPLLGKQSRSRRFSAKFIF